MSLATAVVRAAAPLAPDPDEAREWLERELSDPSYAAAEPTFFDRAARAVGDFLTRLFSPQLPDGLGPAAAVVATVIVVVVLVAALLIWGRPRSRVRTKTAAGALFGDDDVRSATQLREDAAAAAARSEWDAAIILRFRAIARGLAERVIVETSPGATAQAFAREAARAFPASAPSLSAAAGAFDDVRYLRRPGTSSLYDDIARLDDTLSRAQPTLAGSGT